MAWKASFAKGICSFRESSFEVSLSHLNEAIRLGDDQYAIYDSRASVYEKLGQPKDALRDAKKVIELAPGQWQGYARSARLFLQLNKHDSALKMIELAIGHVKEDDAKRRVELEVLKQQVLDSVGVFEEQRRRHASLTTYHGDKLPVEIFGEIFGLLVASDVTQAIVISHVCRHWRAVAIRTPLLWHTLILAKKDPDRKTKEWIKRSQGRIRELAIRPRFKDSGVLLSTALQGFPWNHLRVCRLDHAASLAINQILRDLSLTHALIDLVELEHLGCVGHETTAVFPYNIPNSHLRSLTIKNQSFNWGVLSGLTKLVSLVVRNTIITPGGSLADVLDANPMLEEIALGYMSVRDVNPLSPLPKLHRLTHLDILSTSVHVFHDIAMPSLRILRLSRIIKGVDTLLTKILDRGPVILTELSIQSSLVTFAKLIPFLRAASSLEVFGLSQIDGQVNAVVEALANTPTLSRDSASSPTETIMCPRLAHVKLSACTDLKTGAVMRLVRSRLPAVASELPQDPSTVTKDISAVVQIESLIVDMCPLIEPEVLPWLRSKVQTFSCVYATSKDAKWKR
ncbi:hypothetical protein PILCRDRAFT_830339 [Piloderma croceum F 1598]|uniref:F-box domain-containing protein n=1 Tax=Piloderma croceum (strain F 1598) TaxID=765440 RepID=A0A0C3ACC2_PILCF|nr:hypothetical protein PILCRDRAFT_830339 [Piloderma croceum F 1598]